MWRTLLRFLTPITYEGDGNKTRASLYVHLISIAFIVGTVGTEIALKYRSRPVEFNSFDLVLLVIFLLLIGIWALSRYGYVKQAGFILTAFLWLAVNGSSAYGLGVRDSAFLANFIVLLSAGLLVGWRGAVLLTALTIAAGYGLAYAEVNGIFPSVEYTTTPYTTIQSMSIVFGIFAALLWFLISSLEFAIKQSQADAKQLEVANRDLNVVRINLEENRSELIEANEQLKRRAERINSIANISKTITLVQDLERLLPTVVEAVSERFRYSSVDLYLLDEANQYAILSATSSIDGQAKMNKGYRIKVGSEGIVGFVTDRGEGRTGVPASEQTPSEVTPQSQLVLPLKVREIVIGALDLKSNQVDAFTQEDLSTLQILADQVAISIQNARSAERAKNALYQAEIASRQLVGRGWRQYAKFLDRKGFRYDGIKTEPVADNASVGDNANLASIPVRLRGQVIGRLRLNPADGSRQWTDDELAMAEATAERVALALENARLLENAQNRVQRETFLGELSSKLGASYQLDSILRDTVEELGQTFKSSVVSFQLVNPNASSTEARSNGEHASASSNGKESE